VFTSFGDASVNVPVNLGGCRAPWWFRGSAYLENWLTQRPWLDSRGSVHMLILPSAQNADSFIRSLRQAVRAYDDAASDVRTCLVQRTTGDDNLITATCEFFGLAPKASKYSMLQQLEPVLTQRPHVLISSLFDPQSRAGLVDDALALAEFAGKSGRQTGPSIVLLDNLIPEAFPQLRSFDFTVGSPGLNLLQELDIPEKSLWRSYLHIRFAWEAAGNLDNAFSFDSHLSKLVDQCSDAKLETILNEESKALYQRISEPDRRNLEKYINDPLGKDGLDELESIGLLWRPLGEKRLRPTPWVARAVLGGNWSISGRMLLKRSLVCVPLAQVILASLFTFEANLRTVLWNRQSDLMPTNDAEGRFRSFQVRQNGPSARYSSECPAIPDDARHFLSFGELLTLHGMNRQNATHCVELVDLRNDLAHGQYVTWKDLQRLRFVELRV